MIASDDTSGWGVVTHRQIPAAAAAAEDKRQQLMMTMGNQSDLFN